QGGGSRSSNPKNPPLSARSEYSEDLPAAKYYGHGLQLHNSRGDQRPTAARPVSRRLEHKQHVACVGEISLLPEKPDPAVWLICFIHAHPGFRGKVSQQSLRRDSHGLAVAQT